LTVSANPGPLTQALPAVAHDDTAMSYAGIVVAVSTVMVGMGFGAIMTMAVFLTPLAAEFGWPRGDVSAAYAVATIGTGLGGMLMGHFADRLPVRHVALCGAIVPGLALFLLSGVQTRIELYAYHALLGIAGIGAILAPLNSLASQWLSRRPGMAIGIVSAGGAAGQALIPYVARHLVLTDGWRAAYLTLGVAFVALMVPLALLLRNPPRRAAAPVASGPGRIQLLALLSVAAALCCICMATPMVHVVALGSDRGLGGRDAAGLLAVMMAFGLVGRVGFGPIADRYGSLQAYIAASLGQTLLAFMFPHVGSTAGLYALSALFGLVFSGAMTSFIMCAREYAPAGRTGLAIGVVMFFGWVGMAIGGWQGGVFYDLCGDYVVSFANASIGGVANLLILALLYRVSDPAAPRSAPRSAGGWRRGRGSATCSG
jgi:MFS family permease